MPITSRSEYGLRAMILLAEQVGDERLSASEISRRASIPLKYLEQILAELKRAKLVRSFAGARGGYRLGSDSRSISAGDIIRAVDGPVAPMSCVTQAGCEVPSCDLQVGCTLRPLWRQLGNAMTSVIDSYTLDQLAFTPSLGGRLASETDDEAKQMPPADTPMYHI